MDLQLRGKRALVTGGSRGIGLAVAHALAAEGVDVAIAGRTPDSLNAAAVALEAHGTRILGVQADTTDDEQVRAMVALVTEQLGSIDVLVNSAATPASSGPTPTLETLTDEALHREVDTKVVGYLRVARAVAPGMKAQGWGRIINISGLNARRAGSIAGSIRNVAVAALSKNLADELGPHGINVTVVHPGTTVTERTPWLLETRAAERGVRPEDVEAALAAEVSIGRLVTAEEVADVVTFLASPRSVAINGDAVVVGGGAKGAIHY